MINNWEEALDHILKMVSVTEPNKDLAIGATATIGRLIEIGKKDLALDVLATYRPEEK